jgi:hypothetical protein
MDRAYMEITKNFTGRLYIELLLEWGYAPGVETLGEADEVDVLDGGGSVLGNINAQYANSHVDFPLEVEVLQSII